MEYGPRVRRWDDKTTLTSSAPSFRSYNDTYQGEVVRTLNVMRSREMHDVVTENYYKRSALGEVIINPCKIISVFEEALPGRGKWGQDAKDSYSRATYMVGDFIADTSTFENRMEHLNTHEGVLEDWATIVTTEAYAKVTSAEASVLVTLGELTETKQLLLKSCDRMRKLASHLRTLRRQYLTSGRAVRAKAFDTWLEIRYGWIPLVSDLKAIKKTLTDLEENARRQTFRAFHPLEYSDEDELVLETTYESRRWKRTLYLSGEASAGVLCEQGYLSTPDVWGLTKLPQAMWDLTRLSFAVDWFFNVADTIAAWTPDTLWKPLGNWTTLRYTLTQKMELMDSVYDANERCYSTIAGMERNRETVVYERIPYTERGTFPQIVFKMNWKRYIDALALSRQTVQSALDGAKRAARRR